MTKPVQFVLLLALVAIVATGACILTRHLTPAMNHADLEDSHAWVHQQLGITPEQEKSLEPIEQRYHERRVQLTHAIEQANEELAVAMLEDKAASPRVTAAIEKIHAAQGELQIDTIAHVFEMKAVLTPEQGKKLLELTSTALKSETGHSH